MASIGDYAFAYCEALAKACIPGSVTSIGDYAFERCSEELAFTVSRDSWAEDWCRENGFRYDVRWRAEDAASERIKPPAQAKRGRPGFLGGSGSAVVFLGLCERNGAVGQAGHG